MKRNVNGKLNENEYNELQNIFPLRVIENLVFIQRRKWMKGQQM